MSKRYADQPDLLDVDVRFLLANERTLLAWLRTALGLIAGGIALLHFNDGTSSDYVGMMVTLLGAATSAIGYRRFRQADRAIRQGVLPKAGHGPDLQVAGVITFAVILVLLEVFSR